MCYLAKPSYFGHPVQRPLALLRVMLSRRVIAYYGLIRDSRFLPPPYLLRPVGLRPTASYGLDARASPLCSACLSLRAAFRTPADPAAAYGCSFTACSGLRPIRSGSASASPRSPVPARSRNEAAKFALCYGPEESLALHRQGHLPPSFHLSESPPRDVGYTMRAYSQFPQPDLHRPDTRPYGLQTKDTKNDS